MKFKHPKTKKGMSIVEVVISVALIAILLIPISNVVVNTQRKNEKASVNQKLSTETQKVLEELNSYDKINFDVSGNFKLLDGGIIHYDNATGKITGTFSVKNEGYDVNIDIDGTKVLEQTKVASSTPSTTTPSYDSKIDILKDAYVSADGATKAPTINNKLILVIDDNNRYSYFLDTNSVNGNPPIRGSQIGVTKIGTNNNKVLVNLPETDKGYKDTMNITIDSESHHAIEIDVNNGKNVTGQVKLVYYKQKADLSSNFSSVPTDSVEIGDVFSFDVKAKTKTKLYNKLGNDVEISGNTVKNVVL